VRREPEKLGLQKRRDQLPEESMPMSGKRSAKEGWPSLFKAHRKRPEKDKRNGKRSVSTDGREATRLRQTVLYARSKQNYLKGRGRKPKKDRVQKGGTRTLEATIPGKKKLSFPQHVDQKSLGIHLMG